MPPRRASTGRGMNRKPKREAGQTETTQPAEDGVDRALEPPDATQDSKRCAVAHVVQISEERRTDTAFVAKLSIDGGRAYPITIAHATAGSGQQPAPHEPSMGSWDSLSTASTEACQNAPPEPGRELFEQVFAHDRARGEYQALADALPDTEIQVMGRSPAFHDLPWEALSDPELPRPLGLDCQIVHKPCTSPRSRRPFVILGQNRKSGADSQAPAAACRPSPVLNLLVVAPRPSGDWGLGCQSVARQLVEAGAGAESRICAELLRPGTFDALAGELRARDAGFYQMVHIDCPVSLLSYEEARSLSRPDKDGNGGGRSEFRGRREFLVMEGEEGVELVEPSELAELLVGSGVGICTLNAWRADGRGEGSEEGLAARREASLGCQLMEGGVPAVVAMSHPTGTCATKALMQEFCGQLLAQSQVAKAARLGRQRLYSRSGSQALCDSEGVKDWMLPVVYMNQPVSLNLLDFRSPEEQEDRVGSPSCSGRCAQPAYGFVGRESEVREIEGALSRHNFLLVKGKAGTGKTALLAHLQEWWPATKFAQKVLYFGYSGRPWTLQQVMFEIMQRLYREAGRRHVEALGEQEQLEVLAGKLRNEPCALLFDNLEPVVAGDKSRQGAMDEEEVAKIRSFLGRLVHGETKVVLSSSGGNDWLNGADELCEKVYNLEGLDGMSRLALAEKVLERHIGPCAHVAELLQSADTGRLLDGLGGYPLLMEVVLPNLKFHSPAEVLSTLDLSAADESSGVLSCVEASFGSLAPLKQQQLMLLAPFDAFLARSTLDMYVAELKKLEAFQAFEFKGLDEAVQDAVDLGLLCPADADDDGGETGGLAIEPLFTCFLKTALSQRDAAVKAAVWEGHKKYYQWCSVVYLKMLRSQERERALRLCERQYRNLYAALEACPEEKESMKIADCLHVYFELKGDSASGLKLAHLMCEAQSRSIEMGAETLAAQEWLARWYLVAKDFKMARFTYQSILAIYRCMEGDSKELIHGLGVTYHQLGLVAQELKEPRQARKNYKRALEIFSSFADRHSKASTYYQLGALAQEAGNFDEARRIYLHALGTFVECEDRRSQANIHTQLAGMAEVERDFHEAYRNYREGLELCLGLGDRHSQATAYHHLGIVSQEMGNHEDARDCYKKALDISVEFDDRHSQASTYHQLGRVSQELCQFDEARRMYEQALQIFVELDDGHSQAHTYHQLGSVAEKLRDFDEAQKNYKRALEMGTGPDDRLSQATTYHHLGVVAQHSRTFDEATLNYEAAIAILEEFGDRRPQANTYHQLGIVAQELRKFDDARRDYLRALEIYVEFGDRHAQADTYYQLGKVAQELRGFDEAYQKFYQAMDIYAEFKDLPGQASSHHHLGLMAQELQNIDEARMHFTKALAINVEIGDRHSQASTYFLLAHLDEMQHSYVDARENVRRGLRLFEELKDAQVVAVATRWLRRMEVGGDPDGRKAGAASRLNNRYQSWWWRVVRVMGLEGQARGALSESERGIGAELRGAWHQDSRLEFLRRPWKIIFKGA